jgi:ribonuclease HII
LLNQGYEAIAGIDEVGRGPLAGPVVAAAVILPPNVLLPGVRDSKLVPERRREILYDQILSKATGVGVGIVDALRIDTINILQATFEAMIQAMQNLPCIPDYVLVDGNLKIPAAIPQRPLVGGDNLSLSIAAASIVAKVCRDRMMREFHRLYPQYLFHKNKGYGSAEHLEALERHGPSPIHRRSFHGVC